MKETRNFTAVLSQVDTTERKGCFHIAADLGKKTIKGVPQEKTI
jgi:hypothetical protein